MMRMGCRRGSGGSNGWGRWCLVLFAVVSALCVSGPAIYWKINKSVGIHVSSSAASCPTCSCRCPPPPTFLQIAPGLSNLSVPDCGGSDPDLKKEMGKQLVDLLTEELKLQQGVASEHAQHMNLTVNEARKVASQYQREADKCVAATETCESARERSETLLRMERKLTSTWERRARSLGWHSTS